MICAAESSGRFADCPTYTFSFGSAGKQFRGAFGQGAAQGFQGAVAGADKAKDELAFLVWDVGGLSVDAVGTFAGHPLNYRAHGELARRFATGGSWEEAGRDFLELTGHQMRSGLTLGLYDLAKGIQRFRETENPDDVSQPAGGVFFGNLLGAAGGAGARPVRAPIGEVAAPAVEMAQAVSEPAPELTAAQRFLENTKRGNQFNQIARPNYPYNEVAVDLPGGGQRILDSYNPSLGEIVSRKNTQFGEIQVRTAQVYIAEAVAKYAPGRIIADTPKNRGFGIAGQELRGRLILEVPVQARPVSRAILQYADRFDVQIRDFQGNVYR